MRNASAAYRAEQDQLRPFAEECLIFDETAEIPVRELMAVYKRWCEENQIKHPMSSKAMNQRLEARGVQTEGAWIYLSSIRKSVRGYQGVRLRTEHDPRQAEASPQMSGATRGETEANAADDGQSTLDEAIATQPLASDQPGAPGSPHVQDASRGDINPGAGADLPGIASDAQGPRVGAHAQEDFSPPNSLGEEKPRGGSVATRGRPDSRGRRLAGPPRPAEDVFSDPPVAPPPREPGAAEGETWPPPGEDPAP